MEDIDGTNSNTAYNQNTGHLNSPKEYSEELNQRRIGEKNFG